MMHPEFSSLDSFIEDYNSSLLKETKDRLSSNANKSKLILKDVSSQISLESSKTLPLSHLIVHVEIYSNDTNISETCYDYLEKLGAQIERKLSRKCNLVIWKDGFLKTVEKAKEQNIPVVNSLWLEDCIEHYHCANFDKYYPNLPNEKDLPFLFAQDYKRKRKTLEGFDLDELEEEEKENGKISFMKTSGTRKKRKMNFEKDLEKENKIEIRLGNKFKFEKFNTTNYELEKTFSKGKESKKKIAPQARNIKKLTKCKTMIEENSNLWGEVIDIKYTGKIEAGNKIHSNFLKQVPSSICLMDKQNGNSGPTEETSDSLLRVKNMILSYANIEQIESIKEEQSHKKEKGRQRRERNSSTSSVSKSVDQSNEEMKTHLVSKKQELLVKKNEAESQKNFGITSILQKYSKSLLVEDGSKTQQDLDRTNKFLLNNNMKEKNQNDSKNRMSIEEGKQKSQEKIYTKNKKTAETTDKKAKMEEKPDITIQETLPLRQSARIRNSLSKTAHKMAETVQEEKQQESVDMKSKKDPKIIERRNENSNCQTCSSIPSVLKSLQPSTIANTIISKYIKTETMEIESTSICIDESNQKGGTSRLAKKEMKRISMQTRSQKKNKELSVGKSETDFSAKKMSEIKNKSCLKTKAPPKLSADKRSQSQKASQRETRNSKKDSTYKDLFNEEISQEAPMRNKRTIEKETLRRVNKDSGDVSFGKIPKKKTQKTSNEILFTNFLEFDTDIAKEFCQKFNLKYLEDNLVNVQKLGVLVYTGAQIPKNYRVAFAMVKRKTIVKKDWIDESLEKGKLQEIQNYKVKYDSDCREGLFSKMRFYIDKEFEQTTQNMLGKNEIVDLLQEAGGLVFENIRTCDFFVSKKTSKKKNNIPPHVKIITAQWIIDSIIEGKFLNTQQVNYTIL